MNILTINKISSNLKILPFKMPNAAYSNRCVPCKESQRAFKHIWFLPKRKANAEKPKELEFLPTLDRN